MTATRVLHVLGRMVWGGAELRLVELIERLPPSEFAIDVCALSGEAGELDCRITARGGVVCPLPVNRSFAGRFLRLLRAGRYDVVHSHVLLASGPVLALARVAGVPVRVAHFHAMRDGRPSTVARRLQRRAAATLLDHCATDIIACGEGSMDAVWRRGWRSDRRCRVIYDAVDPARFDGSVTPAEVRGELGVPSDATLFIHVGYDTAEKNHPRLLQIFSAILAREPAAWLLLVGAGTDDPRGPIAARVRAARLQDRVVALGERTDVPRLLAAADAMLLPSFREGLPGVVLEACVAGLPVLATDLPGVREIAARLAGVSVLPLAASDGTWAAGALELPGASVRLQLRERARERFQPSVFHVERATAAHRGLWRATTEQRT